MFGDDIVVVRGERRLRLGMRMLVKLGKLVMKLVLRLGLQ